MPMAVRGRKFFTPSIASLADFRIPAGISQSADRALPPTTSPARFAGGQDHAIAQAKRLEAVTRGSAQDGSRHAGRALDDDPGPDRT